MPKFEPHRGQRQGAEQGGRAKVLERNRHNAFAPRTHHTHDTRKPHYPRRDDDGRLFRVFLCFRFCASSHVLCSRIHLYAFTTTCVGVLRVYTAYTFHCGRQTITYTQNHHIHIVQTRVRARIHSFRAMGIIQ